MKILTVVTSLEKGGAEQVAAALCNGWLAQGHDVRVATVLAGPNMAGLDPAIPVAHLAHAGASHSRLARVSNNLGYIRRLGRQIRIDKPDVIVAHADRTNVATLIAALGTRTPVVAVEHVDPSVHGITRVWAMLRRSTYPLAARLVGVSSGVSATLAASYGSEKVRTIFNPVTLPAVTRTPSRDISRLVAMGRLTRQKGFDVLLDAVAMLVPQRPGLSLTIWGEGEERMALIEQARRLGIDGRVRLAGFTAIPHEALLDGGLFVLASRYEGFGLALAEAMSLGLPVIATDCPSGPADIVRHGDDGLLVPPNDPRALADAIARLIDDPGLASRLGERGRRVRDRFSIDVALAGWQRLFDEIAPATAERGTRFAS